MEVTCLKKSQVPLQNWLQVATKGLEGLAAWPKATATSRDRQRTAARTVKRTGVIFIVPYIQWIDKINVGLLSSTVCSINTFDFPSIFI